MRNRKALRLSAEIAAIRALQCIAVETKAAAAAEALRTKKELVQECEDTLKSVEAGWRDAMTATSVSVDMLALWSAELLHQEEQLSNRAREVQLAADELQDKRRDWHAAMSRRDLAVRRSKKVMRAVLERDDDIALQDALDRHACAGSVL